MHRRRLSTTGGSLTSSGHHPTGPLSTAGTDGQGKGTGGGRVAPGMDLELTPDAAALLEKRGGTLVIDLIRPTG